jgi:putative MFS transporter
MQSNGLGFHHPAAFWVGCAAITLGVFAHMPMFVHASHMGYQMAGMEMDATMLTGMGLIPFGLLLAAWGMLPRLAGAAGPGGPPLLFHVADGARLNREHWKLVLVLVLALTVDVQKPATLGFVMPGMTGEYGISKQTAGLLALVALTGTTVGSVLWGRIADRYGRRAAILLSALMFIGTAICGAMPSFEWNLVMCFLMGASAGGLLPIAFTLMAETVPAAHRGWLLVALGGIGTSAGYLLAAGAAAVLEPLFSWRVLWLLGLPTGALIIFLDRYIPESPRFLARVGLGQEARAVLSRFSGVVDEAPAAAAPEAAAQQATGAGANRSAITFGLICCGLAWGLVNFGFLLWLPTSLGNMGMDPAAASALLARSALLALPGTLLVIWLYHRWSSVKTLVLFILLTAATLLAFFAVSAAGIRSAPVMITITALLLVSASGVIAMLIPYAAEIYPADQRATGSGVVAASSKAGGILGAAGGVLGIFGNMGLSALLIALPLVLAAGLLLRSGIETRGRGLEQIQESMLGTSGANL